MKHMTNGFVCFAAVAIQFAADALLGQKIVHRLRLRFQKIMMRCGDMGIRLVCVNGFQDLQPGISNVEFATQIIPGNTGGTFSDEFFGIIHTAV